jgi:hypothetical protein
MGKKRIAYRILLGKTLGGILGRPRSRWENNIKMELKEIGGEYGLDYSNLK